jgi:hypothetical protein
MREFREFNEFKEFDPDEPRRKDGSDIGRGMGPIQSGPVIPAVTEEDKAKKPKPLNSDPPKPLPKR